MLKITEHTQGSATTLELEGRLAGPWVGELRDSWRRARAADQHIGLVLRQVTFIDATGKQLLAEIIRSGASITAEGCMTQAIIEQVKQEDGDE
jgi:anti-anti-sigma regulatory factor